VQVVPVSRRQGSARASSGPAPACCEQRTWTSAVAR